MISRLLFQRLLISACTKNDGRLTTQGDGESQGTCPANQYCMVNGECSGNLRQVSYE